MKDDRISFAVTECDVGKVCSVEVFGYWYTIYKDKPDDVHAAKVIHGDIKGEPNE